MVVVAWLTVIVDVQKLHRALLLLLFATFRLSTGSVV